MRFSTVQDVLLQLALIYRMLILQTFLHTSVYVLALGATTVPRSQAPEPSLGPRLSSRPINFEGVAQATPPKCRAYA